MAKSYYLSKLLFIAALFVYSYAGCVDVKGVKNKEQGIKTGPGSKTDNVERKTYKSERARNKEPGAKTGTYNVKLMYDSQIGVMETADNSGPRVEEYLRYVKLKKGQPWCAAFICWVYGEADVTNPRSGWSPDLFKESKVIWKRNLPTATWKGSSRDDQQPGTADVFGIWFPDKGRIAHAGFIDQWGKTWLITVEGNTNIAGSREGDGVYRKRRLVRSIVQVARYVPSRTPP